MWPEFVNMLTWWEWSVLASVLPAIVALYFLKLKREPVEVPSTYLWKKSVEDFHVNSIWQRLQKTLLMLMQLLLVVLLMLALMRPSLSSMELIGDRYIFLVDHSASMSTTDVEPSRLEEAKRQIANLVEGMKSGSRAMIIKFSDEAEVVQEFTDNRRMLRDRLETIEHTDRRTSLLSALKLAAGLANPGRLASDPGDEQVARALPATLYVFSDGKFKNVPSFPLGNLTPKFVPIGKPQTGNVAITSFGTRQHQTKEHVRQVYGRIQNFGEKNVQVAVDLLVNDRLVDATTLNVEGHGDASVVFELGSLVTGGVQIHVHGGDALTVDDMAFAAVNPSRRSRVLFVSPGNTAVRWAFETQQAKKIAEFEMVKPEFLQTEEYQERAATGGYDFVVFDRVPPGEPQEMPLANTLWIGGLPPLSSWECDKNTEMIEAPQIIDTDITHPLMQFVNVGDLLIGEAIPLKPPPGGSILMDSDCGPILAIGPRGRFEDVVLAFEILTGAGSGEHFNSDWPLGHLSFPTFLLNALEYLGGVGNFFPDRVIRPGETVHLKSYQRGDNLAVRASHGRTESLSRGTHRGFQFTATDQVGIYHVQEADQVTQRFAVNLFDVDESNIGVAAGGSLQIGDVEVGAEVDWKPTSHEIWKGLLWIALVVLGLEWYIYSRRLNI